MIVNFPGPFSTVAMHAVIPLSCLEDRQCLIQSLRLQQYRVIRGKGLSITGDDYMCLSTTGEDNAQVFESGVFGILWRV